MSKVGKAVAAAAPAPAAPAPTVTTLVTDPEEDT